MDLNRISFTGRLGADPELRYLEDGKQVTNLSVAISTGRDETLWVDVAVWGRAAETACDCLKKGSRVAITGRVSKVRAYISSRTNQPGATLEITADSYGGVVFLDPREDDGGSRPRSSSSSRPAPHRAAQPAPVADDDDLPF